MRHRLLLLLALSGPVLLLRIPTAHAGYTMDDVVIAQAGGEASNGSLVLDFTVGESVVGSGSAGQTSMDCGFWEGVPISNVGVGDNDLPLDLPVEFALRPSTPNPFTTGTLISYAIPKGQQVLVFVGIYDVRGALIRTLVREPRAAGTYSVTWDGRSDSGDLPGAGVYFAMFHAGPFQQVHKVVMLK